MAFPRPNRQPTATRVQKLSANGSRRRAQAITTELGTALYLRPEDNARLCWAEDTTGVGLTREWKDGCGVQRTPALLQQPTGRHQKSQRVFHLPEEHLIRSILDTPCLPSH